MSAHDLLTTRDCTAWSCTAAASGEDGLCDEHRGTGRGYETRSRAALLAEATRLRAEGLSVKEIAARMGKATRTVYEWFRDPDGSLERERKRGYGGICVDCAGPTYGGNGREVASERCLPCRQAYDSANRRWSREGVIEAIQLFAERHGHPPLAAEWMRRELRGPDYPATSSVYRSSRNTSAPFENWADAIEAAGFVRPTRGRKVMPHGQGRNHMARTYVVLSRSGDGHWKEERVEGYSPENAIEKAADGPGEYVAVLASYWVACQVAPVTRLAVVRGDDEMVAV